MFAVIRIRGSIKVKKKINHAMELMRLFRVNHLVLIPETKQSRKMFEKAQDYLTFGEINKETLEKMISKRGMLEGNKKITEAYLKEKKINSFSELAEKVISGNTKLKD